MSFIHLGLKLYWINNNSKTFNAVTTQVESAVIISCALSHPSKKVNFYHTLRSDDKQKIRIDGIKYRLINNQELVILRVSLLDGGDYECEVDGISIPNKKVKLFVNNCKFVRLSTDAFLSDCFKILVQTDQLNNRLELLQRILL